MDTLAIIKRIEIRLSEIGMSKADFYAKSGISSASFSQWKSGMYKASEKKLKSAAEVIGMDYHELITGEKEKPLANNDKELEEYLEILKNRPECRMLFQLSKGCTKEEVEQAVRIIEAIRNK